jgi:hypothetical protein
MIRGPDDGASGVAVIVQLLEGSSTTAPSSASTPSSRGDTRYTTSTLALVMDHE